MIYRVHIKPWAKKDIKNVVYYIEYELFAPIAAKRFLEGLTAKIERLRQSANVLAISAYKDVLQYDAAARHILYKEFAIIYSIHGNLVVIHRVIHGSLIKE